MFKKFPAARRVLIYMVLSYLALVIVNNSPIEYDNMWIIYTPMFVGIYVYSRWIDSRLALKDSETERQVENTLSEKGFGE